MALNPLPEGATIEAPEPAPAEAPTVLAAAPAPLPEGASFDPNPAPLPEGASFENQLTPAKTPAVPPAATNQDVPGFWSAIGKSLGGDDPLAQQYIGALTRPYQNVPGTAFTQGVIERSQADIAMGKVVAGTPLAQAAAELPPPAQDEIHQLLNRSAKEGWDDPKWIAVQIAHGAGSMVPGAGAALLGGAVGIPPAASFGVEAAWGTFVPAYKRAVDSGLSPDDAVTRALIDSGISAATATAMGISPGLSLFGRVQNPAVVDQVASMLKRPALEALAQIGIIQPGLGITGNIVTTLSHGESPNADQVFTDYVTNLGLGGAIVGTHLAVGGLPGLRTPPKPGVVPPATPEEVQTSYRNQAPPGEQTAEAGMLEEPLYPREEHPIFYSPVLQAIRSKVPDNATPEQVISTLRNHPGVKEEELRDLNLPQYLADQGGRISKPDLIAHVEANGLILEEAQIGSDDHSTQRALEDYSRTLSPYRREWSSEQTTEYERLRQAWLDRRSPEYASQVLPGEHSNYREFILKVPHEPVDESGIEARARDIWSYNYEQTHGPWEQAGESTRQNMLKKAREFTLDENPNVYTGSHWPDPNVIAHFRTTDRMDRDGRKVMVFEEGQSDLHQRGAKVGYRSPEAPSEPIGAIEKRLEAAHDKYLKLKKRAEELGTDPFASGAVMAQQRLWRQVSAQYEVAVREHLKQPDLPFKSSWQELLVKRVLRLAADEGYDAVAVVNGDQVGLRQGTAEQLAGNRLNYDKKFPALFAKWSKKMGMDSGYTEFPDVPRHSNEVVALMPTRERAMARHQAFENMGLGEINPRNPYFEINPAAGSRIRMGLPLYEEPPESKISLNQAISQGNPAETSPHVRAIRRVVAEIGRDIKISRPIDIHTASYNTNWNGKTEPYLSPQGHYVIRANLARLKTAEDVYATLLHELGHIVQRDKWASAPAKVVIAVRKAFDQFKRDVLSGAKTVGDVRRLRDNPISEATEGRNFLFRGVKQDELPLSLLTTRSANYIRSFEEWYAEQVARWGSTSERPLGIVDKFFADMGRTVRKLVDKFRGASAREPGAVPELQAWLDSLSHHEGNVRVFADAFDKANLNTKKENAAALDRDGTPESPATSQTAGTAGGRSIIASLPPPIPIGGPAMAAHADRMNIVYEWLTSLPQIAAVNKHIRPLQQYLEIVKTMNIEKNNIMIDAWQRLRQWKALQDPKQLFALNKFIEDYMNADFKLPHTQDGLFRRPTDEEYKALVAKHGLGSQALKIFDGIVQDFDGFLENYRKILLDDASRIKDPALAAQKAADANKTIDDKLKQPFMPAMRFGKYTITVYDHAGNIKHFEQTESLRKQARIVEALKKHIDRLPGDNVLPGELKKDVVPLIGMPPGLLDLLEKKLNLSTTQRAALDQLKFDYAPAQSFKHQFRAKDVTPGYSTDFQRQYAHFFFHGANHLGRVKWIDALRDQIKGLEQERLTRVSANKIDHIANYMTQHLDMVTDPKPDFAALRGLMFHWYLGFNPASATLNLSQTAVMSYPHLASKFGDLRALGALGKAGTDLNNFYKKATLKDLAEAAAGGPAGAKFRALSEAVKEGVISETQAHTLAAVSEDRNLLRAFGSKGEEAWQHFSNASSWMFEMTEQYNRRVAFRAAWELAMADPNNRYVDGVVRDNPLQYKRLRDQGWSHQEAAAFTAAKDSVEKTQFVYAPYARPKLMWGRKGSLFIFKSFTQNTLFNMWANPSMGARSLVVLAGLGGLMGLPGMENINDLIKVLAFRLFGKDFDLEDQVRKFAVDVLNGAIGPDTLLHGMSVKGWGIPQVLNAIGNHVGMEGKNWFPTLDRSKSIGMGDITNIQLNKLFGANKDYKGAEIQALQNASGAGFGNLFALYNFVNSQQSISDLKRWELAMPRALSNISHGFRYLTEGRERNKSGDTVVKFDPHDTEQMGEILARTLGYQPARLTGQWEATAAKQEQAAYYDVRRGVILRQFGEAIKGGNPEDKGRVLAAVRNYNEDLPPEWKPKAITGEALKASLRDRLQNAAKTEAGLPLQKSNTIGFQQMDKYFPRGRPTGQVDARPVK